MESPQNIKKRLKSVNNIGQITKAMELVSATKMRKSQEIALASRPYAFAGLELLANLSVGEKANAYLNKKGFKVIKKFVHAGDYTTPEQVLPLSDYIIKGYLNKDFDRVIAVSTHFKSALKQEPHIRRVLPIDFEHVKDTIKEIIPEKGKFAELIKEQNINFVPDEKKVAEYLIEPNPQEVIEKLAEHLFFMQVYHLILEANASEHSARRMAMKTASDNAKDLSETLNLQYNKSRQGKITTEIAEISAGAEAQQ